VTVKSAAMLAEAFVQTHPAEAALVLERLAAADAAAALGRASPAAAAGVIRRMGPGSAAETLARLETDRARDIVAALPLGAAARLLRSTTPTVRNALLDVLPPATAATLGARLAYPEDAAASLADPHALALPEDLTAGEALARVRRAPQHALYYLYVVDRDQRLVGVLTLRELMLAPVKAPLASVMQRQVVRIPALARRAAIVEHRAGRTFHALPVVDDDGVFLGALRAETLLMLESHTDGTKESRDPLSVVLMLGELWWVGLTGLLVDLTGTAAPPIRPDAAGGGDAHDRRR
jgi:magnesium transporter